MKAKKPLEILTSNFDKEQLPSGRNTDLHDDQKRKRSQYSVLNGQRKQQNFIEERNLQNQIHQLKQAKRAQTNKGKFPAYGGSIPGRRAQTPSASAGVTSPQGSSKVTRSGVFSPQNAASRQSNATALQNTRKSGFSTEISPTAQQVSQANVSQAAGNINETYQQHLNSDILKSLKHPVGTSFDNLVSLNILDQSNKEMADRTKRIDKLNKIQQNSASIVAELKAKFLTGDKLSKNAQEQVAQHKLVTRDVSPRNQTVGHVTSASSTNLHSHAGVANPLTPATQTVSSSRVHSEATHAAQINFQNQQKLLRKQSKMQDAGFAKQTPIDIVTEGMDMIFNDDQAAVLAMGTNPRCVTATAKSMQRSMEIIRNNNNRQINCITPSGKHRSNKKSMKKRPNLQDNQLTPGEEVALNKAKPEQSSLNLAVGGPCFEAKKQQTLTGDYRRAQSAINRPKNQTLAMYGSNQVQHLTNQKTGSFLPAIEKKGSMAAVSGHSGIRSSHPELGKFKFEPNDSEQMMHQQLQAAQNAQMSVMLQNYLSQRLGNSSLTEEERNRIGVLAQASQGQELTDLLDQVVNQYINKNQKVSQEGHELKIQTQGSKTVEHDTPQLSPKANKLLKSIKLQKSPIKDTQSYSATEVTRAANMPQNLQEQNTQSLRIAVTSVEDSIHSKQEKQSMRSGSTFNKVNQPAYEIKLRKQNVNDPETPKIIEGKRQQRVQFQSPEQEFIKEDFMPNQKADDASPDPDAVLGEKKDLYANQFRVNLAPKNVWLEQQNQYAAKKKFLEELKPVRSTPPPFPRCLSYANRQIRTSSKSGNAVFVQIYNEEEAGLKQKIAAQKAQSQLKSDEKFRRYTDEASKMDKIQKEKEREAKYKKATQEADRKAAEKAKKRSYRMKQSPLSGKKTPTSQDQAEEKEKDQPVQKQTKSQTAWARARSFSMNKVPDGIKGIDQINIQIDKGVQRQSTGLGIEPKSAANFSSGSPGKLARNQMRRQSSTGGKWMNKMHAMRQKALQPSKTGTVTSNFKMDFQPGDMMEEAEFFQEGEMKTIFLQLVEDIVPIQYNRFYTETPMMEEKNDDLNDNPNKSSKYQDHDTQSNDEDDPHQINIAIAKENKKKDGKSRPISANAKSYALDAKKKAKKVKKRKEVSLEDSDTTPQINEVLAAQFNDELLENQKDYVDSQKNVKWSTTAYVNRVYPVKRCSKFQYPLLPNLFARDVRILQVSSKNFLFESEIKNFLKLTKQLKFLAFEQFYFNCGQDSQSVIFGSDGLMGDPQIYFESNFRKALPSSYSQKQESKLKTTSLSIEQPQQQTVLKTLNAEYLTQDVHFDRLDDSPENWDSDFDGPTNCVLGEINWDNIVFSDNDNHINEEEDPTKINLWDQILACQEHDSKRKNEKTERKQLTEKEIYQSQNGFQWKGAFWPGQEFILHKTNDRDEIPFTKEKDPRMTQSITCDWDKPNKDEREMKRRESINKIGVRTKLETRFPAPLKHSFDDSDRMGWYNVHLDHKKKNSVNIIREIIRKTMPDCTDFSVQKELVGRGFGIFNNLHSEELKLKMAEKVERQSFEKELDFQGEIAQQILENDPHYYDTSPIVDQIEQEFNQQEHQNSHSSKNQELCFLKFSEEFVNEHPDYGYLVQLDLFLRTMDLNNGKYSNPFLKEILPAIDEEIAKRTVEPTIKLIWMLQMDKKLLDAVQNPFYTPFHLPELLQNMAVELNIFHMAQIFEYYEQEMLHPSITLNFDINNKPAFPLRRKILRQCLEHFNLDIVIGVEQQHRSARLFTRKLASAVHRHLQNKQKVNIACAKQLFQREALTKEDFREMKRHWCLPDHVDDMRDNAMRLYVTNDYTNCRNRLFKPEFKQFYDSQKTFGIAKLLGSKENGQLHSINLNDSDRPIDGLVTVPAIFREFDPVKVHINPDDTAATNVAANFVKRNTGTLLEARAAIDKKNQDILNAFDQYQRKWHVSANFIHMPGFYFDGGPEDSRKLESTQGQRTWNEHFQFYETFVPVFEKAPEYMVPTETKPKPKEKQAVLGTPQFSLDDLNRVSSDAEIDSIQRGQTISLTRDKMLINHENSKVMSLSSKTNKTKADAKSTLSAKQDNKSTFSAKSVHSSLKTLSKTVKINSQAIVDQPITSSQIGQKRVQDNMGKLGMREMNNNQPIMKSSTQPLSSQKNVKRQSLAQAVNIVNSTPNPSKGKGTSKSRVVSAKQPKSNNQDPTRQISITIGSGSQNQLSSNTLHKQSGASFQNAHDVVSILKNVTKNDSLPISPQTQEQLQIQQPLTIHTIGAQPVNTQQSGTSKEKVTPKGSGKKQASAKKSGNEKKTSPIEQKPTETQNTFKLVTADQLLANHAQQKTGKKAQQLQEQTSGLKEDNSKKKKGISPSRKSATPSRKKGKIH